MTRSLDFDARGPDVPRDLFPTGRVKFSLGVDRAKDRRDAEAKRRRARMQDLRRWQAWDVLHAIQTRRLSVAAASRVITEHGEAGVAMLRAEISPPAPAAPPAPTFREAVERYTEWYAARRGEQAHAGVKSRLGILARGMLGEMRIDEIARNHVEKAIMKVDVAASTRETYRMSVSGLFTWLIREEADAARLEGRPARWTENPATAAEVGHHAPRQTTATEEQVIALLSAAEIYQRAYLRAFLHIGFRRDELRHTRFHADLDVETWIWRIQPRGPDPRCSCLACRGRGWRPKGWPKNKRSARTLLVPEVPAGAAPEDEVLRSAITQYLELYPCEPGDFVFRNPRTGEPWTVAGITRDFEMLCRRADVRYGIGVPGGLHLHALRHTAATAMIRAGTDSVVVAAILGDTVQTIAENYVHITREDLARGIARGPAYR